MGDATTLILPNIKNYQQSNLFTQNTKLIWMGDLNSASYLLGNHGIHKHLITRKKTYLCILALQGIPWLSTEHTLNNDPWYKTVSTVSKKAELHENQRSMLPLNLSRSNVSSCSLGFSTSSKTLLEV